MKLFYPPNSYCNELAGLSGGGGLYHRRHHHLQSLSLFLKPILPFLSPLSLHPFCLYLFHRGEGGREAAVTAAACFMLLSRRRRRQRGGPTAWHGPRPPSKPQFLPPPVFQAASRMRRVRGWTKPTSSSSFHSQTYYSPSLAAMAMISLPDRIRDAAIPSLSL